jgi:bifunctional DNase/RNase
MTNDGLFVRVSVSGMVRDPRDNPVMLLKSDEGEDVLPIWIGHAEAMAIELHLKGTHFERPLTHDLLSTLIENLGAAVVKVSITDLREGTFFAKIHLQRGDDVLVIDARPSDSVVLALKCSAPIFVSREVFSAHKRTLEPDAGTSPGADDELRRYLKDLDPGEF